MNDKFGLTVLTPEASTQNEERKYKFHLDTPEQILSWPDPQFLIQDVIVAEGLNVAFGASGCFKTFFAMDACACIATGRDWFGHATMHGPIVYVVAEGRGGFRKRFNNWRLSHDVEIQHLSWFRACAVPFSPFTEGDVAAFISDVTAQIGDGPKPVLIVFDTLSRTFAGGDESSTRDMAIYVAAIDRIRAAFGAAALILHHLGWNPAHERGNSALRCATDMMLRLDKTADAIGTAPGLCTLSYEKCKDFEPPRPLELVLKRGPVEGDGASLVIDDVRPAPAKVGRDSKAEADAEARQRKIVDALKAQREFLDVTSIQKLVGGRKDLLRDALVALTNDGTLATETATIKRKLVARWRLRQIT